MALRAPARPRRLRRGLGVSRAAGRRTTPHRPEDKAELHRADGRSCAPRLDDRGRATRGRTYLLTFAAGAFPRFHRAHRDRQVQASVDFVNLMTYDFRVAGRRSGRGPSREPLSEHPPTPSSGPATRQCGSSWRPACRQPSSCSACRSTGAAGCEVGGRRNGLYQPGNPLPTRMDRQLLRAWRRTVVGKDGFERSGTPTAQAPYLWNASTPNLHHLRRPRVAPPQDQLHSRARPRRSDVLAVQLGPVGSAAGRA